MDKCWAFYPIAGTRLAWIPCVRKAEAGSRLCKRHGDAVTGVLFGALAHRKDAKEIEARREEAAALAANTRKSVRSARKNGEKQ